MKWLDKVLAFLTVVAAYFMGRKDMQIEQKRVDQEAELKAKEAYDKAEAKIRHEADVARARLPDAWPESGIIELHVENGQAANRLTSADMQLERD